MLECQHQYFVFNVSHIYDSDRIKKCKMRLKCEMFLLNSAFTCVHRMAKQRIELLTVLFLSSFLCRESICSVYLCDFSVFLSQFCVMSKPNKSSTKSKVQSKPNVLSCCIDGNNNIRICLRNGFLFVCLCLLTMLCYYLSIINTHGQKKKNGSTKLLSNSTAPDKR